MTSNRFNHRNGKQEYQSFFEELWNSFWYPPRINCPKCGNPNVDYYDPFFFSPIRTLKGHRRVKCPVCKFIWRPSRRRKPFWQGTGPL